MSEGDEDRKVVPEKTPRQPRTERPPVEFHDPFGHFDFEPTDGGDF